MEFTNIQQINDFISAIQECSGDVWLESIYGDKINLKSQLSMYIALDALLSEHGKNLELFCSDKKDEQFLYKFFNKHPETI